MINASLLIPIHLAWVIKFLSEFENQMSSVENDIYYLYERGENLGAFLYGMKHGHPKTYSRMLRTIQSIAPYISDFFLQPNSNHLMHKMPPWALSSTSLRSRLCPVFVHF